MIKTSRGLRQDDLLSPYLFLFCAEGLNAILKQAVDVGEIQGFFICRRGPKLTHLFFTNNCLFFYRSSKVIPFLPIYSCFVRKVSMLF